MKKRPKNVATHLIMQRTAQLQQVFTVSELYTRLTTQHTRTSSTIAPKNLTANGQEPLLIETSKSIKFCFFSVVSKVKGNL